jgi:hypothetical protein
VVVFCSIRELRRNDPGRCLGLYYIRADSKLSYRVLIKVVNEKSLQCIFSWRATLLLFGLSCPSVPSRVIVPAIRGIKNMSHGVRLAVVSILIITSADALLHAFSRANSFAGARQISRRSIGTFASAIQAPVDVLGDGGVVKVLATSSCY